MCNNRKAGTYDNKANYPEKVEGDYQFIQTKYGAVITQYTGDEGSWIEIPAQLGDVAVKGISGYVWGGWFGAFQEKSISRMRLSDDISFIGDFAFYSNQLTDVTIPDSVTFIGGGAFRGNQLTSVIIPNSVSHIGDGAFYGNRLNSVTIPNSVSHIGSVAFYDNQLNSVTIPDSVTYIGGYAFQNNKLTNIIIGAGVELGNYSFGHGFEDVYNRGGKQAGTYTRPATRSESWTRQ